MPGSELKYVHVCSEGKTLGKILQSLIDIRGDISDNSKKIAGLSTNVDELNKQINNGLSGSLTRLKKRVEIIENGERPKLPGGKLKERRATASKILDRLTKKEKIILGVALIPLIISNGVWILKGIGIAIDFLINVWPK